MNSLNDLHKQAMELADQAMEAERNSKKKKAEKYFKEAFVLERQAAMKMVDQYEVEPSRSILFRSAAALALRAGKYRDAEQMAAFGLSGNPPLDTADELRDILNQSLKHLRLVA